MKKKIISMVYMILVLAVGFSACAREETVYLEQAQKASEETEAVTPDESKEPAFCCVYVCGAVVSPGVYTLPADARICDALEAAGGFDETAAKEAVNLAEKIQDAEQIRIPTVEEVTSGAVAGEEAASYEAAPGIGSDGRVNLNTATKEELMTVPGIGNSKAESILAYRMEHGCFADVRDIMKIAGIKEGIFEKIKDSITVN